MNRLLLILIWVFSWQAHAEIFVCEDNRNQLTYQDEPCASTTLRKLKNVPDAPIADQILARERMERANARFNERAAVAELERRQQEKLAIELQAIAIEKRKLELLEKQTLAAEQSAIPPWILGTRPAQRFGQYRPYINKGVLRPQGNRSSINRQQNNRDRSRQR